MLYGFSIGRQQQARRNRHRFHLRYEGLLEILDRLARMFDDKPAYLARTSEGYLTGKLRSSFHEFQHGRGTAVPALRAFQRSLILRHGVAQSLQLRISNPVELHPELEDREGEQLRGLRIGVDKQRRPALFQCRKNRIQSSFRTRHQRFSMSKRAG
jgi:hypothetical protein